MARSKQRCLRKEHVTAKKKAGLKTRLQRQQGKKKRIRKRGAGPLERIGSEESLLPQSHSSADGWQSHVVNFRDESHIPYVSERSLVPHAPIIRELELVNFMCHDLFRVRFGKCINILMGRNGSGKSAVAAAIVLVLGGRGTTTGRSNNVRTFIKFGTSFSVITLTLNNYGLSAYNKDLYGSRIQIIRKITADGSSVYLIKNAKGCIVGRSKGDVDHLVKELNIQYANPLNILNQDASRQLLYSKSNTDKYKFFMMATQIADIEVDYRRSLEKVKNTNKKVEEKRKEVQSSREELQRWEEQHIGFRTLARLEENLFRLAVELAWAKITEKENQVVELQNDFEENSLMLPIAEDQLAIAKERSAELSATIRTLSTSRIKLIQKAYRCNPTPQDWAVAFTSVDATINELETKKINLRREGQELLDSHDFIVEKLYELRTRDEYQEEIKKQQERKTEMQNLQELLVEMEGNMLSEGEAKVDELTAELHQLRELIPVYRNAEDLMKVELFAKEQELNRLMHAPNNNALRYGPNMPALLSDIDKHVALGFFEFKPVGPLGLYINVIDKEWAIAAEECLGDLLHTFCVASCQERHVLERLFDVHIGDDEHKPPIGITESFRSRTEIKITAQKTKFKTMLNMLDIKNRVARNFIIDQREIENIFLLPNNVSPSKALKKLPYGFKEAFTAKGQHLFPNATALKAITGKKIPTYLGDLVQVIEDKKQEMEVLLTNLKLKTEQIEHTLRIEKAFYKKLRIQTDHVTIVQDNIFSTKFKIQDLASYKDPITWDVLTSEREGCAVEEQLAFVVAQRELVDEQLMLAWDKRDSIDERLCKKRNRARRLMRRKASLDIQINELKQELTPIKEKVISLETSVQRICDTLSRLACYRDALNEELTVDRVNAAEYGAKPQTLRPEPTILHEIFLYQQAIREESAGLTITFDAYEHERSKRQMSLNNAMHDIHELEDFLKQLKMDVEKRLDSLIRLRDDAIKRITTVFRDVLFHFNFMGSLLFDHKEKTLKIDVKPSVNSRYTDLSLLSCGERSFSTVCFLASLWQCIYSPIRILDEFDAFMDIVTRTKTFALLLSVIESTGMHTQFIFMTPLTMQGLETNLPQKILLLPAPEPVPRPIAINPQHEKAADGVPLQKSFVMGRDAVRPVVPSSQAAGRVSAGDVIPQGD